MRLFLTLCSGLALAACSGEAKKETGGKADGEILPASVSDAMLPRDTVRSQAPLAPKATSAATDNDKADAKPADKQEAASPDEPTSSERQEPAE